MYTVQTGSKLPLHLPLHPPYLLFAVLTRPVFLTNTRPFFLSPQELYAKVLQVK
jgi:hypothetical protein